MYSFDKDLWHVRKHTNSQDQEDEEEDKNRRSESPTTAVGAETPRELPNELSAPYEVPQFPIEQIEKKLLIQRQLNVKAAECAQSVRSFGGSEAGSVFEEAARLRSADDEEPDVILPHFQRVAISGEDTSGVPLEDLQLASSFLVQALEMRKRYMELSMQSYAMITSRFIRTLDAEGPTANNIVPPCKVVKSHIE
ncbi:AMP deaminase 2, partial [Operophtera brumata]